MSKSNKFTVEIIKHRMRQSGKHSRILKDWHEGITKIPQRVFDCFEDGFFFDWRKAKSYVIYDAYYGDFWCISKEYFKTYGKTS